MERSDKMKIGIKILILFLILNLLSCKGTAQETDTKNIATEFDFSTIETTRQIVVVTVDSISPYSDIQKFATDLSNYLGVGDAEKNNGLTIVMCNPCRKIGIATGTGTELILTNDICKKVIDQTIIPELKNGNFYVGIKNGVIDLIEKWE